MSKITPTPPPSPSTHARKDTLSHAKNQPGLRKCFSFFLNLVGGEVVGNHRERIDDDEQPVIYGVQTHSLHGKVPQHRLVKCIKTMVLQWTDVLIE